MKVIVCGGRSFAGKDLMFSWLDKFHAEHVVDLVLEGGQTGADSMAKEWAKSRGILVVEEAAEWDRFGRSAGPIRNQKMIDRYRPDAVIAFAGNRGTKDMRRRAESAGLTIYKVTNRA